MTTRLFISDLHLEEPESRVFLRFKELMLSECRFVDEIHLLGDLVEMWIGDDDDAQIAISLNSVLSQASEHCDVFVMHGNRDFLFGDKFAKQAGVCLNADPFLTEDGLLLTHGDAYCTDDAAYQQMRSMFRSDAWQSDILSKTLSERKALGQMLRAQSKAENSNKSANIMDVNAAVTQAQFAETAAMTMIHGHTHRPGIHRLGGTTRYVLGAWERCGWGLHQDDDKFELFCFPLSRPYELFTVKA
ncbi:MAG: UDP-2,3-diacylglucosamine diphosphatase [Pseudomonadales bacterium]|nr:UDP-2,3-diacylglucosamine diphosphatase [Pseudomonadales bacterium]